jgi:hypothetical protein
LVNFRIYMTVNQIGYDYYEAEYQEYTPDGVPVECGTEDFTKARLKSDTKNYAVYVYTGKVNEAGKRTIGIVGYIRMSNHCIPKQVASLVYENVALVERQG